MKTPGTKPIEATEDLDLLSAGDGPDARRLYRGLTQDYTPTLIPSIFRSLSEGDRHPRQREMDLFDEFLENARGMVNPQPTENLEWLAIARHHEMVTRLLDWTADARVALRFALAPSAKSVAEPCIWTFVADPQDVGRLWGGGFRALPASGNLAAIAAGQESVAQDPFSGRGHAGRTLVFPHMPVCSRIRAQHGWFMWFSDRKEGREGLPTAFEENPRYYGNLTRWSVDKTQRDAILADLVSGGINEDLLFPSHDATCDPTLDSLCKRLSRKWSEITDGV